jgi:hypothetical protein
MKTTDIVRTAFPELVDKIDFQNFPNLITIIQDESDDEGLFIRMERDSSGKFIWKRTVPTQRRSKSGKRSVSRGKRSVSKGKKSVSKQQ